MILISDLIKVIGFQQAFIQQLTIRRAAVSRLIGAHVEMRVNIYRDPILFAENSRHRAAIRIRNIISAAQGNHFLSIFQQLRDDFLMSIVSFFERRENSRVAGIVNSLCNSEVREFVKLFTNFIGRKSRANATLVSRNAFILRTSNDYNFRLTI